MFPAALTLAVLAIILAWPVPILLSRARWTWRAPGTALVLWQSIALAGGLSMLGSLLTWGLIPFGDTLPNAIGSLVSHAFGQPLPAGVGLEHVAALCGALYLGLHLTLNLAATVFRAERQRRRHHHLVELLSEPMPDRPGTRVLDHAAPVAYCLPGAVRSITVLSAGLLALLDADELRAVIAHERAHLRQQHHVVLLVFKSWHSALPWFPIANRAENAVALLVEMLADDQARRIVDDRTLARAIALVGTSGEQRMREPTQVEPLVPESLGQPFDLVTPRVRRLAGHPSSLPTFTRAGILGAAVALLAVPTSLLLFA